MFGKPYSFNDKIFLNLVPSQQFSCTAEVCSKFHLRVWQFDSCVVILRINRIAAWRLAQIAQQAATILEVDVDDDFNLVPVKIPNHLRDQFLFHEGQHVRVVVEFKGFFVNNNGDLIPRLVLVGAQKADKVVQRKLVAGQSCLLKFCK